MNISSNWCLISLLISLSSIFYRLVSAQPFDYPIANLSTIWKNSETAPHSVDFNDGATVRAILLRGSFGPRYACGFYCNGNCDTNYLFAIFIVQTNSASGITLPASGFPQVVWSANRDNPVRMNATLELTLDGDLVLRDADGSIAWSTSTGGKSVVGLNLTETGNLVLFDKNNSTIWQSFDYPTDSLVPGQKLMIGQKLTASVSLTNWSEGLHSFSLTDKGLFSFVVSDPRQVYYERRYSVYLNKTSYVRFRNGSLSLFQQYSSEIKNETVDVVFSIPEASSAQYMRLGPDGHLKVYEWQNEWNQVADPLTGYFGECNYPMVCGKYGICSNGFCGCPTSNGQTNYFKQESDIQPMAGCVPSTPLSCESTQHHSSIELRDITYFTFASDLGNRDRENIDSETCKQACLTNCSCKAAFFLYNDNFSAGDCYLLSEIFSMMKNDKGKTHYNSTAFLKIQTILSSSPGGSGKKTREKPKILGISLGSAGVFVLIVICGIFFWLKNDNDEVEEADYLDHLPGLPRRFSYEELENVTEKFTRILGRGGFGSVFEGTLNDGTKVAVKLLEGLGQIKKSFLTEVEVIGSIQHVNLVGLIGFCAEKSHWLLVYEYMPNGSLDRWIFNNAMLDWKQRKKIILDIAKGLTYLHEDCRQKIVHLDIKPQNILLDDNFNAKVCDFGLSKLIDRKKDKVMTTMRGTPGYLAPEWLNSIITEKVDVYSFGVVTLEILCGRKNLDRSLPEEDMHLLSLLKKKAEEGALLDLVDTYNQNMQLNGDEVVKTMKLATWCLQSDFTSRPSMAMVVKVLEGVNEVEQNLDYNFFNPVPPRKLREIGGQLEENSSSTILLPSILSGPR
ncbi:G-type lectin S-receptor-like serine/threonine-protein kinase SD2-5 [Mangifera indica]|uniref:G-type lectin S-receptor-like serine/threonine-protein kinase SD2-5 n=1 Tax=Mangifera indica TaxID=29780 RepID=UPI001CFA4E75|nr:G-type lectin S-receptor-like serine/threonine-protein kinase SD2-5 [Mangifera indica]